MAVHIRCKCGKEYDVPDSRAAKSFKCFVCNRELTAVPPTGIVAANGQIAMPPAVAQPAREPFASLEAAYAYALAKLGVGMSTAEIEREMIARGIAAAEAGRLTAKAADEYERMQVRQSVRTPYRAGYWNMLLGAGIAGSGIVLGVGDYLLGWLEGSGSYAIPLGLFLVGILQLLRGFTRWIND